jgi:hypothetical protein
MRRRQASTAPQPVADDGERRDTATELTVRSNRRWLVMWMPHGRVFNAFFMGESDQPVILIAASARDLWTLMTGADPQSLPELPRNLMPDGVPDDLP